MEVHYKIWKGILIVFNYQLGIVGIQCQLYPRRTLCHCAGVSIVVHDEEFRVKKWQKGQAHHSNDMHAPIRCNWVHENVM